MDKSAPIKAITLYNYFSREGINTYGTYGIEFNNFVDDMYDERNEDARKAEEVWILLLFELIVGVYFKG